MSDDESQTEEPAPSDPGEERPEGADGDDAVVDGPVDQLGIPMSREPTIDDVRSDGEAHRKLALGCSVLVTLFVVGFWLVRGYLL